MKTARRWAHRYDFDNQRARQARTLEAPNGARVIFPLGTTHGRLLDQMLKWVYEPILASEFGDAFTLVTPFRQAKTGARRIGGLYWAVRLES